jgi:shikimate kinase / 3-dehydroquinate synthase
VSDFLHVPLPVPPLPPGRPNLVLAGFMGTGKTTAGRVAAELLGLPFVDLDLAIEAEGRAPVAALFERLGEPGFRGLERTALLRAARLSGTVIASGGGAVASDTWAAVAEDSIVAVLTAELDESLRRALADGGRPLLAGDEETARARARELLASRSAGYAGAGPSLDTTRRAPGEVAAELAARYRAAADPETVRVEVPAPGGPTAYVAGPGLLERLGEEVRAALPGVDRVVAVHDGAVAGFAWRAGRSLEATGVEVLATVALPPGERAKSWPVVAEVWDRFLDAGLDQGGAVIAIGGGAALDVAGFAAATFARGVPLVNVPTTVLAMLDASVGGKTGIDHGGIKNAAGAFHHSSAVLADLSVLAGLPVREARAGLAEAVKAFVLASPLALEVAERLAGPLAAGEPEPVLWAVEQAVRVKAAYVGADPSDRLARHALNLGHTFAHALEAASGYAMRHGEAVAIGLVAAARLACRLGRGVAGLPERLESLLGALGLPSRPPEGLDRERLAAAMGLDKKRRAGRAAFVLPAMDGAELVRDLPLDLALAALLPARRPAGVRP